MNKTIITIFDSIALTATFFLLAIIAFNIVARQVHDISSSTVSFMIPGVIELSKYTLLIIVFSALPHAITHKMVRVDLLSDRFPSNLKSALDQFWLILMTGFIGILTGLFIQKTTLTFIRGDATQDLQVPLFYIYAFISLACIATVTICLSTVIQACKCWRDK